MGSRTRHAFMRTHTRVAAWLQALRGKEEPDLAPGRAADDPNGWGGMTAEDLRAQGITPGLSSPAGGFTAWATAKPPRRKPRT